MAGAEWIIAGGRSYTPAPFLVAGIVNITPDSFSDGGQYGTPQAAMAHSAALLDQGADMLDLGAESTRPGAVPTGHELEWQRLAPVLKGVCGLRKNRPEPFTIAIDTYCAQTAGRALELGADIINDISGTDFDQNMPAVLAEFKPGYVLGHSLARPAIMQHNPSYENVVDTLLEHFTHRMNVLVKAGLPESHICLDPCIGFGKNLEHTCAIFKAVSRLASLGRPLYFGVSRKSFLGMLTGLGAQERGACTQVAVALLAERGVAIHRVHDVAATRATLRMVSSLVG